MQTTKMLDWYKETSGLPMVFPYIYNGEAIMPE